MKISSQIQYRETTYYSKDIREIASVLHNVTLFIGADSGMMHLASASLVPTIDLFSKKNLNEYKPYGNNDSAINTNLISIDDTLDIVEKTLMKNKLTISPSKSNQATSLYMLN